MLIGEAVDHRLSTMLLAADLAPGRTVRVDTAADRLTFTVESPVPAATA